MKETRELAAERTDHIRELLQEQRVVSVATLCRETGASAATIRRDLVDMENRGLLQRVHGGAISSISRLDEPLYDDKAHLASEEKLAIAALAVQHVSPNHTLFLDGGSTVLALARMLEERTDITVVTNSLGVAISLCGRGPRLILTGGELRRRSQTLVGSLTEPLLNQLHVDCAFMGTIGLSIKDGLTTTDPREAQTKSLVFAHAQKIIMLADSSKFGKTSFVRFGDLKALNTIITDGGAKNAMLTPFRKMGIKIEKATTRNKPKK